MEIPILIKRIFEFKYFLRGCCTYAKQSKLCVNWMIDKLYFHHDTLYRSTIWALFNIKMSAYQYRKSHCRHKTILRPSMGFPILVRWHLYIESGPRCGPWLFFLLSVLICHSCNNWTRHVSVYCRSGCRECVLWKVIWIKNSVWQLCYL